VEYYNFMPLMSIEIPRNLELNPRLTAESGNLAGAIALELRLPAHKMA
jgi:hypothetical protein